MEDSFDVPEKQKGEVSEMTRTEKTLAVFDEYERRFA